MRDPMRMNSTCLMARSRPEQVVELAVGEQQRIAAAKQHVAHLGMRLDVAERPLVLGMEIVVLRVAHQPAARAVPAIGGAAVGHQEQHPVGITVHQSRHRRMLVLAERIEHFLLRHDHFVAARDDLPADRAVRIVAIDEVEKIGRDREGQLVIGKQAARLFLRRERHELLKLGRARDAVLQLPVPIPPFGFGKMLPQPLAFEPAVAVFSVGHDAGVKVISCLTNLSNGRNGAIGAPGSSKRMHRAGSRRHNG